MSTAVGADGARARVEALALDVADAVRTAVAGQLGRHAARAHVGWAPGGDATLAIDEIAETVLRSHCADAGDVAYYSEDAGLVRFGTPEAILVVDPIDGTRPAAAGFEACVVSVAVVPPDEQATLGDVWFGVVEELKSGDRFWARRGGGAFARTGAGAPIAAAPSPNTDLRHLYWASGQRARPMVPVAVVLEALVDGSSMNGGYFDLGSAAFCMTRIVTGQLDAYVDPGARMVAEFPALEAAFRAVGNGSVCTNFPYDVAAAALIVQEAGGTVTLADGRPLEGHPAVGSGDGYGLAVLAAASDELHRQLLAALDEGLSRLGSWLGNARAEQMPTRATRPSGPAGTAGTAGTAGEGKRS